MVFAICVNTENKSMPRPYASHDESPLGVCASLVAFHLPEIFRFMLRLSLGRSGEDDEHTAVSLTYSLCSCKCVAAVAEYVHVKATASTAR